MIRTCDRFAHGSPKASLKLPLRVHYPTGRNSNIVLHSPHPLYPHLLALSRKLRESLVASFKSLIAHS